VGDRSGIEWTDATWNPTTGCTKVSPGCDNCYAARITNRFHGPGAFDTVEIQARRLEMPLHWRRPRRVFVDSMSDLFHAEVDKLYIEQVFDVMWRARQHTFQVLTKRAERMERVVKDLVGLFDDDLERFEYNPPPNVWLGVSVESAAYYSRIHHLLSCEPLLGPLPHLPLEGIGWVIVGGESGPGARPMHPEWARSIRDQCGAAGVPFFFKQWGEWAETERGVHPGDICLSENGREDRCEADYICFANESDGTLMRRVGKHVAGRLLDGRPWDEMPAVSGPAAAI
jgi:protein gp37